MALVLNATPGDPAANAYCTLEEAEAYHESVLDNSSLAVWDAAAGDPKNRAIVQATRLIDEQFEFDGDPTDEEQSLQWPRSGMWTARGAEIPDTEIPQDLKNATAELARCLLTSDRTAESTTEGIASIGLGALTVNFDTSSPPARKVVPDRVREMLAPWGAVSYGSGSVPLVRT